MVNKTLKMKLQTHVPQNEPTGFGQHFTNWKPKVKPTEKYDVLKT